MKQYCRHSIKFHVEIKSIQARICVYLAISTVSDEFLWVLRHLRVEVVHHHQHHGGADPAAGRVRVDWVSSAKARRS